MAVDLDDRLTPADGRSSSTIPVTGPAKSLNGLAGSDCGAGVPLTGMLAPHFGHLTRVGDAFSGGRSVALHEGRKATAA